MAKIARNGTSLAVWQLQIHLPMQESLVRSLGWEDPLEEEMATHSSILVWNTPRTEEPGGLQSMGLQRLGHDLVTKQQQKILKKPNPRKTPKRLQQKGDVLVQALGKSRNCPGVHDANDVARTQRFQPHSPPRGGWFPHTVTPILPRQALSAGAPPDLTEQIPLAASEGAHPAHTSILGFWPPGEGADKRLFFQLHSHHFVYTPSTPALPGHTVPAHLCLCWSLPPAHPPPVALEMSRQGRGWPLKTCTGRPIPRVSDSAGLGRGLRTSGDVQAGGV